MLLCCYFKIYASENKGNARNDLTVRDQETFNNLLILLSLKTNKLHYYVIILMLHFLR